MELERVEKPLRQLRKMLKKLPQDPPPEEVHKLRTHARRIEAVAKSLEPAAQKQTRRLLKALKPVRKAAGTVRDMDVLTADLLRLAHGANNDSIVRLIEHLGEMRKQNADLLRDTVQEQRGPARRSLKNYGEVIESFALGKKPVRSEVTRTLESADGSGSAADRLISEIAHWPSLNSSNLHDFRLKVKEARYLLQAFPGSDPNLIEALGAAKDQIGEWHDWLQLGNIAREVLDPETDDKLLAKIEKAGKQKLTRALAVSNALHRRFLTPASRNRKAV